MTTAPSPLSETGAARPRRSCLYVPGTNDRAIDKARGLGCDVVIFDLEDSVAPDAKQDARDRVVAALAEGDYGGRELVIRLNGLDTPWGADDLAAAAATTADALLLPKVTGPDIIVRAGKMIEDAGGGQRLWAMMETARGILAAPEIAQADPRLAVLAMGLEDFAKELHADNAAPRTAMLYALERCVLVGRAFGLGLLDGVYPAFGDDDGFKAACAQGAMLGFDGKQLIHPRQIEAANAAFAPSPKAVEQARRLIAAFEAARARGDGIAQLDGTMIEALHVARARDLVAFAEAMEAKASTKE
jgi:citrate lyase subunit beta/citryl-CoA lyase